MTTATNSTPRVGPHTASSERGVCEIVVCETCGGNERDAQDRPPGAQLRNLLERERTFRSEPLRSAQSALAAQNGPATQIRIAGVRCLWACKRSCNVHLRAPGKFSYLLGEFEPSETSARALLDYAELYAASEDGSVPFRSWPAGVRGHFQCRMPPESSAD